MLLAPPHIVCLSSRRQFEPPPSPSRPAWRRPFLIPLTFIVRPAPPFPAVWQGGLKLNGPLSKFLGSFTLFLLDVWTAYLRTFAHRLPGLLHFLLHDAGWAVS